MTEEVKMLKEKIMALEKEICALRTNLNIELALRYVAEDRLMQFQSEKNNCNIEF